MQENMFMECPMRSGKENFKNKIGWRFDNSYTSLPKVMLTQLSPVPVKSPKLIILNHSLTLLILVLEFVPDMNQFHLFRH